MWSVDLSLKLEPNETFVSERSLWRPCTRADTRPCSSNGPQVMCKAGRSRARSTRRKHQTRQFSEHDGKNHGIRVNLYSQASLEP